MRIFGMGPTELIIIVLIIVLLIFGPKNLPKLGKAIGRSVKGLRDGLGGDEKDEATDAETKKVEAADDDDEIVGEEVQAKKTAAKAKAKKDDEADE